MLNSRQVVKLILDGDEILIEYSDIYFFGQFKFYTVMGKGRTKYVIANLSDKSRTIGLHQCIMSPPIGLEVDHINGNGLDNRRSNLRIVTHQINQNNLPKKKNASSRFRGVSWDSTRDSWAVQITFQNQTRTIGRFKSETEAAWAYNNEVIKLGLQEIKGLNLI